MGDERDPTWGLGESRGDDEDRPNDLEHGGTFPEEVANGNPGRPVHVGGGTRDVPVHEAIRIPVTRDEGGTYHADFSGLDAFLDSL